MIDIENKHKMTISLVQIENVETSHVLFRFGSILLLALINY